MCGYECGRVCAYMCVSSERSGQSIMFDGRIGSGDSREEDGKEEDCKSFIPLVRTWGIWERGQDKDNR